MSEQNKPIFGITTETQDSNSIPIPVAKKVEGNNQFPNGWEFPIAKLVNVVANPEFKKNDGSIVAVLDFIFKDADGRRHIHREWAFDNADPKLQDKVGYMQVRIKHLYKTIFGTFPTEGIGNGAADFGDFFNIVSSAFNNIKSTVGEGDAAKEVKTYARVPLYLKLTYYKKNLGFPLAPNFVERVQSGKPCKILVIHPVHDKLAPTTGGSNIPGTGGAMGGGVDDLPSFDDGFED